jgi:hypothetical protein
VNLRFKLDQSKSGGAKQPDPLAVVRRPRFVLKVKRDLPL